MLCKINTMKLHKHQPQPTDEKAGVSWSVSNLTFQPFNIAGLQGGIRCMCYLFTEKGHVVKCQDSSFGVQCCVTSAVPNVRLMSTNNCFTCFNPFMLVFLAHRSPPWAATTFSFCSALRALPGNGIKGWTRAATSVPNAWAAGVG